MYNQKNRCYGIFEFVFSVAVSVLVVANAWADGMEAEEGRNDTVPIVKSDGEKTPPIRKTGDSGNTNPLSEFELAKFQYCGVDEDCVIAINGCCNCVNGGKEVSVNKQRLEAFRARFDCLHVKCGNEVADPPCASGVVSCVSHRCRYMDVQRPQFQPLTE